MDSKALGEVVEANPKRPYKLYAAIASAFIASFVASGVDLNPYVEAAGTAVVAALAVFVVPNPLREKEKAPGNVAGDLYLGE